MAEEKSVLKQLGSLIFGADASPPPARRNSGRGSAAPKPAPAPSTSEISLPAKLPAGTLQVIGLAAIRAALGDQWEKSVERIYRVVESTLRRRLDASDAHYKVDPENYLVLFTRLRRREAEYKAAVITREIENLLLGELDSGVSAPLTSSIAEVDRTLVLDRVGSLSELMAYVRAGGTEEVETSNDSITLFTAPPEGAPPAVKPAAALGPGPDLADLDQSLAGLFQKKTNAAFLKECSAGFYPAYSVRRRSFPVFDVSVQHQPTGREADQIDDPLIEDKDELSFYIDRYALTTGLLGLHRMLSAGHKGIVSIRVSYRTLSVRNLRDVYISRLKEMPSGIVKRIAVVITAIPDGTPASRVSEMLSYIQPFCSSRIICIRPDPALVDLYAGTNCHAFMLPMPDEQGDMAGRFKAVAAIAKRADWYRRESILTRVTHKDDVNAAVAAGITFVEGPAVAGLLDTPGHRDDVDNRAAPEPRMQAAAQMQ
jgi:hypothetical protein